MKHRGSTGHKRGTAKRAGTTGHKGSSTKYKGGGKMYASKGGKSKLRR